MIKMRAMKLKLFKWLISVFIVFEAFEKANAQGDSASDAVIVSNTIQNDSLYKYLQIAAENNPFVKQKFYEFQAALERIPQAGSLPDAEFTAGVFLTPMELVMGNQVADLSLMQMFPWFGVLKNAKDEMSFMAKASYESMREAKLQLFYDVQRTWYEMYRLQKNIALTEKNIRILQMVERLSLSRYKSGSLGSSLNTGGSGSGGTSVGSNYGTSYGGSVYGAGSSGSGSGGSGMGSMGSVTAGNASASGSSGASNTAMTNQNSMQGGSSMSGGASASGLADIYRIQIEISELENNVQLLKNQQNTTLARFNAFLNRPSVSQVALPDTLISDTTDFDIAVLPDSINENNPALAMLQYEQQSLAARKEMNRRMGMPMIGVGLNYSVISQAEMSESEMSGRDMVMPMVKVTLPIYRKKYKAMQNEAVALKNASEQTHQFTANNLQSEYYEALQLFSDAQRRIQLYTDQRELAQRSVDIMIRSFSSAASQLTDVLTVRQQLLNYELLQVQAVTDYNTSIAWLKKLSGSVPLQIKSKE